MSNIVSFHGFDIDMFEVVAVGPVECKTSGESVVRAGFNVYFKGGSLFIVAPIQDDRQVQFFTYEEMQNYIRDCNDLRKDFCAKFRELCEVKDEVSL